MWGGDSDCYQIFYTLDSSKPNEDSCLYQTPILIEDNSKETNRYSSLDGISSLDVFVPKHNVDKCIVLRAIAMSEDDICEEIQMTYFIGYDNKSGYDNLPIISLVMDPEDLFDYESGIYVSGKIYEESDKDGYPETIPANYTQKGREWERPACFTFFDTNHNALFSQNIGVRIHGGWSRAFNQKSFNLYARKEYSGSKTFKMSFFDTNSLQSCMLRSGGYRDTFLTKTRDALIQDMSKDELFSVQNSFPCIVFLNGEYWGLYNLQERFTEYYVEEHFGVDKDNVVIIENGVVDEGEDADIALYEELVNFFIENEFNDDDVYKLVNRYIDVQEFASYMATELYVGNIDWPGNNVRMWRARTISDKPYEDGKWHFMMYDTDDSSGIHVKCEYDSDPFLNKNHWKDGPLDSNCILGLMLSKLLENDSFNNLFNETFARIGSENFNKDVVSTYIKEKTQMLSNQMVLFYQRFISEDTDKYNEYYFKSEMDKISFYFMNRYEQVMQFLNIHL